MRMSVHKRITGLAVLAAGVGLLTAVSSGAGMDDKTAMYKNVLPDDMFAKLVTDDVQIVKEGLSKAQDKKMAVKAKDAALMIAVYAQGAMQKPGANTAAMAGLRDQALRVVKAIADGKFADAAKLADELKPTGKADPAAKATPLPVH